MNRTDFSSLLAAPSKLNPAQTAALFSIVNEFPYFQAARALHLKGLKNEESFKYNKHSQKQAFKEERSRFAGLAWRSPVKGGVREGGRDCFKHSYV